MGAAGRVIDHPYPNLNQSPQLTRMPLRVLRNGDPEGCKRPIAASPGAPYCEGMPGAMATNRARIQILLVEDDPDDVLLLLEALRETRIANDLHLATDGEEAMDFFTGEGGSRTRPCPALYSSISACPKRTAGRS
jgi:hypothetical protein